MMGHCGMATPEPDNRTQPPTVLSANNITNKTPNHDATEADTGGTKVRLAESAPMVVAVEITRETSPYTNGL
jgi:hypothetical protein